MVCFSLLASLIAFNVAYVSYYYQGLLLGLLTLLSYQLKKGKKKTTQCEEIHKVENSQFPSYPLQRLWSQIFGNCFLLFIFWCRTNKSFKVVISMGIKQLWSIHNWKQTWSFFSWVFFSCEEHNMCSISISPFLTSSPMDCYYFGIAICRWDHEVGQVAVL